MIATTLIATPRMPVTMAPTLALSSAGSAVFPRNSLRQGGLDAAGVRRVEQPPHQEHQHRGARQEEEGVEPHARLGVRLRAPPHLPPRRRVPGREVRSAPGLVPCRSRRFVCHLRPRGEYRSERAPSEPSIAQGSRGGGARPRKITSRTASARAVGLATTSASGVDAGEEPPRDLRADAGEERREDRRHGVHPLAHLAAQVGPGG